MSAQLFFLPYQVATVSGIAQPGATITFYTTGTTTLEDVYSDSGLTTPLTNPVTANGAGRFPDIYLDSAVVYRVIVKDRAGSTLEDVDPYTPGTIDVVGYVADGDKGDVNVSGSGAQWTVESIGGTTVSAFAKTILDDADAAAVRATIGAGAGSGDMLASNNLSDVADVATARDNLGVPSDAEMTAAIAAVASGNPNLTAFVSGGQAIWVSGFTYKVTAASYYINGTLYSSAEQSITLDAADGTFDRIDVIALDNTGTVQKITGTAAAAPSEPDIDPATQIEVTFVTVATGTTAPATAANENVYLEDAEWTTAVTGTHITKNSTNNPRTGTKCIEATSAVTGDSILLNKGSTVSPSAYTAIVFYIRNKTASWGTTQLRVHFQNASGTRVGNIVTVSSAYGFSTANTSSYQAVSIPLTAFAIPATALLQKFNIAVRGSTAVGWYIDDMVLQLNGAGTGSASGLTQTQADARYAQRSANLSDLQSASSARTNLGLAIGSNVQAWDADLDAIAALSGTNTIYYRSASNTWSPVTIGSNLTFSAGTLSASSGASTGERTLVPPLASAYTLQNGTGTAISSVSNGMLMTTSAASNNIRFAKNTAGPASFSSFTIIVKSKPVTMDANTINSYNNSIIFRNSTSGKILIFSNGYKGGTQTIAQTWSSYTAFNGGILNGSSYPGIGAMPWMKVVVGSGNVDFYISPDGINWGFVVTTTLAGYISSIDEVGVGVFQSGVETVNCIFQSIEIS